MDEVLAPADQAGIHRQAGAGQAMLQALVLPDDGPLSALAAQGGTAGPDGLALPAGEAADFGSWMNFIDLATWARAEIGAARLHLRGTGCVTAGLWHITPGGADRPHRIPLSEREVLSVSGDLARGVTLPLAEVLADGRGLAALRLRAETPCLLTGGGMVTDAPPLRQVRLAMVITTFRREDAVAAAAARLTALMDSGQMGGAAHLFVIDNGQSLSLPPHPRVTLIANRNLGGAGGFARGLAEARTLGFSHCLFMDDDAACEDEAILRLHAFLQRARDPDTAVAGAMLPAARPWQMWEIGARFDGLSRPLWHGTDLRDTQMVARMLIDAGRDKPRGFYGGWWLFAFPLATVRHDPFPFFVRGDDSGFSLANPFRPVTLNGVASVQEDFSAKQSPLTAYLDLRYHLHHLLVQPGMPRRARWTVPLRQVIRPLARMHYDSAEACLLAMADVMQGPDFFRDAPDLGTRRADIAALTRSERWVPDDRPVPPAPVPPSRWFARLMKATLNGHLLPFWGRLGRDVTLSIGDRGAIWPVWGAARLTYVDGGRGLAYSVRHDKRRFGRLSMRMLRLVALWYLHQGRLARDYRRSYPEMTSPAFWQGLFVPPPAEAP